MPPKPITENNLRDAYNNINDGENGAAKWDWYRTNLKIIENFLKLYPENKDPKIVAVKVALIDSTNSTHFSTQQGNENNGVTLKQFAENIVACNFDERIKQRCPQLVTDISKGLKTNNNGWGRNFLSLASKYCNYHNRLLKDIPEENRYEYPIYDSKVCDRISLYINDVTTGHLKYLAKTGNYVEFNNIIARILDDNGITKEMMPDRKIALDCFLYGDDNNNENNN